jgi:hypothetical protein
MFVLKGNTFFEELSFALNKKGKRGLKKCNALFE